VNWNRARWGAGIIRRWIAETKVLLFLPVVFPSNPKKKRRHGTLFIVYYFGLEYSPTSYRLELLPAVPAYHRQARDNKLMMRGQLVYYGPMPAYYGIGEIQHVVGDYIVVDFRGTGYFGVHVDLMEPQYLIPIPNATMALL